MHPSSVRLLFVNRGNDPGLARRRRVSICGTKISRSVGDETTADCDGEHGGGLTWTPPRPAFHSCHLSETAPRFSALSRSSSLSPCRVARAAIWTYLLNLAHPRPVSPAHPDPDPHFEGGLGNSLNLVPLPCPRRARLTKACLSTTCLNKSRTEWLLPNSLSKFKNSNLFSRTEIPQLSLSAANMHSENKHAISQHSIYPAPHKLTFTVTKSCPLIPSHSASHPARYYRQRQHPFHFRSQLSERTCLPPKQF